MTIIFSQGIQLRLYGVMLIVAPFFPLHKRAGQQGRRQKNFQQGWGNGEKTVK